MLEEVIIVLEYKSIRTKKDVNPLSNFQYADCNLH